MRLKTTFLRVSWLVFFTIVVFASGTSAQGKKIVIIKSDPPGAMLYVKGENSYVGVTPLNIKPTLIGQYELTLVKSGYEKAKVVYNFKGTEKGVLKLSLVPKTPLKAGIRSLVIPGWGQMYSERKRSAILISLVQAGVGIFALAAHNDYNTAYNNYENAMKDYEVNKWRSNVRDQYWEIVVEKHKKANDAFDKRQTWLYITGGLWIYNFLDSIVFFPPFDNEIFKRALSGISPNFQNDTVGLTFSYSF